MGGWIERCMFRASNGSAVIMVPLWAHQPRRCYCLQWVRWCKWCSPRSSPSTIAEITGFPAWQVSIHIIIHSLVFYAVRYPAGCASNLPNAHLARPYGIVEPNSASPNAYVNMADAVAESTTCTAA